MANVPQIIPTRNPSIKENLVVEKFADTMEFADTFYALVQGYLDDINSVVQNIPDIPNTITIPDVNTTVDTASLEELLRDIPENPLTDIIWPDTPTDTFNYVEDINYSDDLFSLFDTKLQDMITDVSALLGGTIESDIVFREAERDELINQDIKATKAADWSERGFELPGGGLFTSEAQIDIEYQNAQLTKSRDQAVETRKLEIENTIKTLTIVQAFEEVRMNFKSSYWIRKLEAAKTLLERGTAIFLAEIEVIKAQAQAYQAVSTAYAANAGALAEIASAQYDGVKAAVAYASVKVQASTASMEAEIRELELRFGTSMEGAKAQANLAAQIMASALSAVNATASISSSDSANMSTSLSASEHWQHYMDESPA